MFMRLALPFLLNFARRLFGDQKQTKKGRSSRSTRSKRSSRRGSRRR
ncbi:hypothetical protein CLV49_3607 [Labedella gwakjiensis]|uniref:Uncharacterized protein n=1 Tax=Labedella gwakjiensis TaxID=390269 RepID=A0A2P8H161_9MICO|nr:hypothetical protein [Labedella gwakjiensis]PSL39952.1 hypothetical protein CLV49_3607 [Labedella gwakjiensis]